MAIDTNINISGDSRTKRGSGIAAGLSPPSMEVPKEVPKEVPREAPKEGSKKGSREAPKEGSREGSKEASKEVPREARHRGRHRRGASVRPPYYGDVRRGCFTWVEPLP